MGSPSSEVGRKDHEGSVHEVKISKEFYLGKYEVTQGQWEAVMGTQPWDGQNNVHSGSDYPAVYISWNDAQEFIGRLNASEGSEVYRLPTEAEWEYACRAGTTTRWSFGDDENQLTHYAWYRPNRIPGVEDYTLRDEYSQRVGTKRPNPWGLYDMHGNVEEWVQDWLGDYSSASVVDPQGPSTGTHRVMRGSVFFVSARHLRSAFRVGKLPDSRTIQFGFRLLRQAD